MPQKYLNILRRLKHKIFDGYSFKSYSQEGEDMILRKIFRNKKNGFYIDVGAHHPKRFSNTYYFYKKGWRGINIDAMPGSMKLFNKLRPNDVNIEVPISNKKEKLTYYAFKEPALNGFSEKLSEERIKRGNSLLFKKEIQAEPLENILDDFLPSNVDVDFLSIDVEGLDYNVLCSNNFDKNRPRVILIELLGENILELKENKITIMLSQLDYIIFAKSFNTVIFMDRHYNLST